MRALHRPSLRRAVLCGAFLLGGCASAPAPEVGSSSGHCWAPAPNLRAAYNRRYTVLGHSYTPLRSADGYDTEGTASWYGWESGSTTAMGTRFNPRAFTAASRQLPLPTCVRVINLANGRSTDVLVNDRGPFVDSRIMDLSYGAALALGVTRTGTAHVRIVALADLPRQPAVPVAPPSPGPMTAPSVVAAPAAAGSAPGPQPSAGASVPLVQPLPASAPLVQPLPASAPLVQPLPASAPPLQPQLASAPPVQPLPRSIEDPPPATASASGERALDALIARADATPQPPGATAETPPARAAEAVAPLSTGRVQAYVQTGAFTAHERALAERDRLRAAGFAQVDVVPGMVRGVTFWRVQIGPLPSDRPDATLRSRLTALGLRDYTVVQQ